jgi:hypothetical protein
MGVTFFAYRCGCPGELTFVNTLPTNREKEKLWQREHGLCPDCYRGQMETAFMEKWGRRPSVRAVSEQQKAFGERVLMSLLGSQRVRLGLAELLMSTPDLPVQCLLDSYMAQNRVDPPAWTGMISWQEFVLKGAYPDHWATFIASCDYPATAEGMADAQKQARAQRRMSGYVHGSTEPRRQ